MSSSILLKNGIVLLHSSAPPHKVTYRRTSVLIEGNVISKIGDDVQPPDGCEVVDCAHKIVAPGFVDTHRHLWQTALKGLHANHTLLDYMPSGKFIGSHFTPDDGYWGALSGCLESLDAGTTTVVDHAHISYSPEHIERCLGGMVDSGIRGFYCAAMADTLKFSPQLQQEGHPLPPWFMQQLEELGKKQPFADGRVRVGLAFDGFFLPKEMVVDLYTKVRSWGLGPLTTHYCEGPVFGGRTPTIETIDSYGLLKPDILISHATGITEKETSLLQQHGGYVSTTPVTELAMALGAPVSALPSMNGHGSLGIDCHSATSASIPDQMRHLITGVRGARSQLYIAKNKNPATQYPTAEDAYILGTMGGANAVGLGDKIGSIQEGKLADVLVIDATSPGMNPAAENDPVAALVMHATIRDVEMVIVDGIVKKRAGSLVTGGAASWKEVAQKVRGTRDRVAQEAKGIDFEEAKKVLGAAYHIPMENITDEL